MPRSFDIELSELESLHNADPATTLAPLRKALTHKNNYIVAKAAKLAATHNHTTLTDSLAEAFPRFLRDPAKSDPQCWAKNALAQTLATFEYQDPALFLLGLHHIQPEPVWGGQEDTAGTLRGICALALVQCRTLSSHEVLTHLLPLFADKQLPVRVNAARAVEQIGTPSAALLLRLRAELASDAPELLGACYGAVLRLDGPAAIPWAAKFLAHEDPAAEEAALSIAETRTEQAADLLIATHKKSRDPDFRATLCTALALTRHDKAIDYLFTLIDEGSKPAREALLTATPTPAILARLQELKT